MRRDGRTPLYMLLHVTHSYNFLVLTSNSTLETPPPLKIEATASHTSSTALTHSKNTMGVCLGLMKQRQT
jgi:hypothetical protein